MGSATATAQQTLPQVRNLIGASSGAAATLTGAGVGVALIDTGVSPVAGLSPAQIVNGPDLSFESQAPALRYLDTYGHGTHMAGIINGNGNGNGNVGIAPKSKVTSVKVGTSNGTVDVSQVMAAVDWIIQHRNDDPAYPIRVINLSYGTAGSPSSQTDPVSFAVEQAWKAGIVVIAASGNEASSTVSNPGNNGYVIAVGSSATKGTVTRADDTVSTFANGMYNRWGRNFDVAAPGESILSLRVPGSSIDNAFSNARVGDVGFRGSGTSQAAAVTSGATALLLQARPSLTPDQVKKILISSGVPLSPTDSGRNALNLNAALAMATPSHTQASLTPATGTGLLEAARGPAHVEFNHASLSGERSIFGPLSSANWASRSRARTAWAGGVWMGSRFAGDGWTGTSWASRTWGGATWSGTAWNGQPWADPTWSGRYWSGRYWSGGEWSGRYWSSDTWASTSWG